MVCSFFSKSSPIFFFPHKMGLFFQKSEMLCMWKNGLSLSVLCMGSFPEKPGRLSETEEIQAVAAAWKLCWFWVRIEHREDKTSEVSRGFLKIWQSLCHGSTLTHSPMSSSWQRHCWDILPQAKVLQEDLGSPEAVLQWRSELCVSCWARSPRTMLPVLPDELWVIDGDSSSVQLHR